MTIGYEFSEWSFSASNSGEDSGDGSFSGTSQVFRRFLGPALESALSKGSTTARKAFFCLSLHLIRLRRTKAENQGGATPACSSESHVVMGRGPMYV